MTDKSTPGPWVVDEDHKGMGEVRVYEGDLTEHGGRLVAVFGNAENDHERKVADARLGAAAPELYEALEQILDDMGEDRFCCCPAAKAMGVAALAKARGEKA